MRNGAYLAIRRTARLLNAMDIANAAVYSTNPSKLNICKAVDTLAGIIPDRK